MSRSILNFSEDSVSITGMVPPSIVIDQEFQKSNNGSALKAGKQLIEFNASNLSMNRYFEIR
jgi:hypothetical protein